MTFCNLNRSCKFITRAIALAVAPMGLVSTAQAANFISNPGFETGSGSVVWTGLGATSAPAQDWGLYSGTINVINTATIVSSLRTEGTQAIEINVDPRGSVAGVYQYFSYPTTPYAQFLSADVYVKSGAVEMFAYQGGTTFVGSVTSTTTNGWETLSIALPAAEANLIAFYAVNTPADFIVDNTYAGATINSAAPEPASWAMMVGGFGLVGSAMRQRRTNLRFLRGAAA
jgi:hypothetical protein